MPNKVQLTDKQMDYIVRHFKDTDNEYLCTVLPISLRTLKRIARRLGLTKTKAHMKQMQREAVDAAKRSHLKNGTYPPKGYIIPNSEQYRFKNGHKEKKSVKMKRLAKSQASRRETVIRERMRIMRGEPQQTKMRLVAQPREKVCERYLLKKRGYIIDDKAGIAYWTPATDRALKTESRQRFYKFEQLTKTK